MSMRSRQKKSQELAGFVEELNEQETCQKLHIVQGGCHIRDGHFRHTRSMEHMFNHRGAMLKCQGQGW